jgi:predicted transcriptional regulator
MKQILEPRCVRLVPSDWQRLASLAEKNNVRVSELIRKAIAEYLKYRQPK